MNTEAWTLPDWLPRVLLIKRMCPRCTSIEFKPAELRPYDGLIAMFFLHPVRCTSCWRRYYWLSWQSAE